MIVTSSPVAITYVLLILGHHAIAPTHQLPLTLQVKTSSWRNTPSADESGHLVFNSASSYLQHWPNTRWRNGHSIVPGYITPGTLLYHGSRTNATPPGPQWCSFDFEHAYNFGPVTQTYAVTGPGRGLKILYFDGTSASSMNSGTIDTQVLLIHGKFTEDGWTEELGNIYVLCDWGRQYGIGGFVRMEFDFEVMLCDFTKGVKLVSKLSLIPTAPNPAHRGQPEDPVPISVADDGVSDSVCQCIATYPGLRPPDHTLPKPVLSPPEPLPEFEDPWPSRIPPVGWKGSLRPAACALFEVIQAGNWHNTAPGVPGVDLDYSSAISLFDPKYTSLVAARRKIDERDMYRAGNITREDTEMMFTDLDEVLKRNQGVTGSGVKWADVMRSVKERHSQRLERLALTLRPNHTSTYNITATIVQTRYQVLAVLTPFLTYSPIPSAPACREKWLATPMHHCANTITGHISEDDLTPQERLIKRSIEVVMRESCRTMGVLWLDTFESEEATKAEQNVLVKRWREEVERLMDWLGWAEWTKCEPACERMEICTLPQWPFDMGYIEDHRQHNYTPRCMDQLTGTKG